MRIVVGTRGSDLAVTQTKMVLNLIKKFNPDIEFELKTIKTKGDIIKDLPINKIGGKEIFIKEIEKELLDGSIDMAVHSMKDMPGVLPKGLRLSHIPKREDPRDVLVLRDGIDNLEELPRGAKIGTGSKRRKYQILKYRSDLEIIPIRGNIETRIKKIETENLDGVILAAAGIHRLGLKLENKIVYFDKHMVLPSPCQGILAIEIREDDERLDSILKHISHNETEIQTLGERAFLKGTGGSCHVPVGAYSEVHGRKFEITGLLGSEDGGILIKKSIEGSIEEAEKLGLELAKLIVEELDRNER